MQNEGMVEITNPSSILISERDDNPSGSAIVATIEGTRPLLIELQALTTPTVLDSQEEQQMVLIIID